jgi:hypothetical protein
VYSIILSLNLPFTAVVHCSKFVYRIINQSLFETSSATIACDPSRPPGHTCPQLHPRKKAAAAVDWGTAEAAAEAEELEVVSGGCLQGSEVSWKTRGDLGFRGEEKTPKNEQSCKKNGRHVPTF